jgi:predicted ATPase
MPQSTRGLASADHGGERYYYPELLRLKGELLLKEPIAQPGPAERRFSAALCVARQQGALALELRAALSISHLFIDRRRHDEARRLLTSVYDRFTEGFGTTDLQKAKELLAMLQ